MTPTTLKGFNLFINGIGYAGRIDQLNLPKLALKTASYQGAGMDAPLDLDMGMEKLECSFTLSGPEGEVVRLFGRDEIILTARGSVSIPSPMNVAGALALNNAEVPVVVRMAGLVKTMEHGPWKFGEKSTLKVGMTLNFYSYSHAGHLLHLIDVHNCIRIINEFDQLASRKLITWPI